MDYNRMFFKEDHFKPIFRRNFMLRRLCKTVFFVQYFRFRNFDQKSWLFKVSAVPVGKC